MSKQTSLIANILFSTISWSSSLIFLVVLILAARLLGDETYGQFAFAFSLVALFEVTVDIGMKTYLVREVARTPLQTTSLLGRAVALKTVLSAITAIALTIIILSLDFTADQRLSAALLTVAMISKSYKLMWRNILVAHEQFRREAMVVAIDRVGLLGVCAAALFSIGGLVAFSGAYCVASIASLAITYAMTDPSLRRPNLSLTWSDVFQFVKGSLPFGLTSAAFIIYLRIDSVMLGVMRNDVEVGWYSAAYRLIEGLIVVPMILQYVLYPRVSILHMESSNQVTTLVRKAGKYLVAAGIVIAVVGILVAEKLIQTIYGEQYLPAAAALQLLLGGITFMFLASVLRAIVNAVNRPHVALLGGIFGAIVNIALNFYLIPLYGYLGTSISTVVAEVCLFSFLAIDLRRHGYRIGLGRSFVKPALAILPSVLLMTVLSGYHFTVIVVAGVSVYFAGLLLLRFFERDEIEALVQLRERIVLNVGGRKRG